MTYQEEANQIIAAHQKMAEGLTGDALEDVKKKCSKALLDLAARVAAAQKPPEPDMGLGKMIVDDEKIIVIRPPQAV